jgi:hypothetical protein
VWCVNYGLGGSTFEKTLAVAERLNARPYTHIHHQLHLQILLLHNKQAYIAKAKDEGIDVSLALARGVLLLLYSVFPIMIGLFI